MIISENNFYPSAFITKAKMNFWRASTFWVLLIGYIGYYLCRANLSAAFPLLSKEFNFSNSDLGLIAMYSELVYALGKFINGPIGDRLGSKKIFLLGMLGAIVSNLAFAQGSSLNYFIVVWCICRYFLSMGWGGVVKTVGAWYPPEKNGTIMGIISISFQLGGVIATLFAGYLVSQKYGWEKIFIYPAFALGLIMVLSFLFMKSSPEDVNGYPQTLKNDFSTTDAVQSSTFNVLKELLTLRLFQQLLLFSFFTTFLRSMFMFWTAKFLVDIGMKDSAAIVASSVFPLVGCLGTFVLGWYTDNFSKNGDRSKAIMIMLLLLAVCLFTISEIMQLQLTPTNINIIILLIGLSGFFLLGPYSMSAGCMTLDITGPRTAATAAGWIDGVGYLGGALAVWATGAIADSMGWRQVFLVLGSFALASAFSALMMGKVKKQSTRLIRL